MNAEVLRFQLRRERFLLPIWVVGITALFVASGLAVNREFGDEQERAAVVALAAGNPAFLFLRGLPDGTGAGALAFFQTFSFLAVLIGLMNVFLITRHSRAEEDSGRSELLQAAPIGRTTTLASALTVAAGADLGAGVLIACAGMVIGLEAVGASLTGLALAVVGLAFAGIAALSAQIMPTSRGANGLGAAAVGVAYLIRGIGDALGTATDPMHVAPSWISFLSPIGWAQRARPFSDAEPWPLLVPVILGAVTAVAATVMRSRRDLGESIVQLRLGRPRWAGASPSRLAIRTQIGTTVGWSIATAVLGLLAGLLSPFVLEAVGANDDLAALIGRLAPDLAADTGELFAIALLGISATLATAAGVQAMMRLRSDEVEGRAEVMLTARMSRTGWFMRQLATAAASTLAVSAVAGLSAGLGFVLSTGDGSRVVTSLATIAAHLPAGAVFIAVTALAFALLPRLTAALGWGLLAVGLVVGQLGDLIGLPSWVQDVSPFRHVPAVPLESFDPGSSLIMMAVVVVLAAAAAVVFRARDLTV